MCAGGGGGSSAAAAGTANVTAAPGVRTGSGRIRISWG
jgi:hypothetical protein